MKVDLENAKFNPASVFKRPADVLKNSSLTREQKIEILQSWAYDERDKAVATEENMPAPNSYGSNLLSEIVSCLIKLGVDDQINSPTKQG